MRFELNDFDFLCMSWMKNDIFSHKTILLPISCNFSQQCYRFCRWRRRRKRLDDDDGRRVSWAETVGVGRQGGRVICVVSQNKWKTIDCFLPAHAF